MTTDVTYAVYDRLLQSPTAVAMTPGTGRECPPLALSEEPAAQPGPSKLRELSAPPVVLSDAAEMDLRRYLDRRSCRIAELRVRFECGQQPGERWRLQRCTIMQPAAASVGCAINDMGGAWDVRHLEADSAAARSGLAVSSTRLSSSSRAAAAFAAAAPAAVARPRATRRESSHSPPATADDVAPAIPACGHSHVATVRSVCRRGTYRRRLCLCARPNQLLITGSSPLNKHNR